MMNDERIFKKVLVCTLCPLYLFLAFIVFLIFGVNKVCAEEVSYQFKEIYDITSGVGGNLYTGYNYITLSSLGGHTLRIGTSDVFTGNGEGHIQLEIKEPVGNFLAPYNPFRMYYYDGSMNKIYIDDNYFNPSGEIKALYDVYFPVSNVNTKCNVYLELKAYGLQFENLVIRISGSVTVNEIISGDENTQNVIDNQNQNTQNIMNNQNQNTQNIINNQNQNNQNVINNNNQNTDNIINNQNNNFNDLNNNINNQFNTCKDVDIKNEGDYILGYAIGVDGNNIQLSGLLAKQYGILTPIDIHAYESVSINGLTSSKYYINIYDKNDNLLRTLSSGNQTITFADGDYSMGITLSKSDYNYNLSLTGKKCGNRLDDTNDKLDEMLGGELEDNTPVDDSSMNDYLDKEDQLIDKDSLNNINKIDISVDTASNNFIWDLITRILNTHTLVFGLMITMLSLGIVKLILNR